MSWQLAYLGCAENDMDTELSELCLFETVDYSYLNSLNEVYDLPVSEVILVVDSAADAQEHIEQWLREHDEEMRLPNLRLVMMAESEGALRPSLSECLGSWEDSLLIRLGDGSPIPLLRLLVQEEKKRRNIAERLQLATHAAFSAMTATGQMGEVVRFLEQAFHCVSQEELFNALCSTLEKLGLTTDCLFFVNGQTFDFCRENADAKALIKRHAKAGRLVDKELGLLINYDAVSGLIYDMPEAGSEAEGQLKDTLATLFESCNFCIKAIQAELASHQAEKAKILFLSTLSHELRTPMNAILGFSRLLGKRREGDAYASRDITGLKAVEDNANRLMHVIDDLLSLCDIDEASIHWETVNLRDVLFIETEHAELLSKRTGIAFSATDIPLDLLVETDVKRLRMIVHCLLSNAFKFTEQGEVTLAASVQSLGDGAPVLLVSVSDTGIGVNKADQVRIFEPFVQVSEGLSRTAEGVGLGLAVVNQYTTQLGGSVEVISEPAKGSLFQVWLPLGDVEVKGPE